MLNMLNISKTSNFCFWILENMVRCLWILKYCFWILKNMVRCSFWWHGSPIRWLWSPNLKLLSRSHHKNNMQDEWKSVLLLQNRDILSWAACFENSVLQYHLSWMQFCWLTVTVLNILESKRFKKGAFLFWVLKRSRTYAVVARVLFKLILYDAAVL